MILLSISVGKHSRTLSHTLAHSRTLSHTLAHSRTLSHTLAHSRTLSHTLAHSRTLLHTLAHSRTLSHTLAHSRTLSHTLAHSRTLSYEGIADNEDHVYANPLITRLSKVDVESSASRLSAALKLSPNMLPTTLRSSSRAIVASSDLANQIFSSKVGMGHLVVLQQHYNYIEACDHLFRFLVLCVVLTSKAVGVSGV